MTKNIGTADGVVRAIIGLVIIVVGLIYKSWWGALGLIPLITAFTRFCGLYTLLGVSTCQVKKIEE